MNMLITIPTLRDGVIVEAPLPEGWVGVEVHTQAEADELVPRLLATEARRRVLLVRPREAIEVRRWFVGEEDHGIGHTVGACVGFRPTIDHLIISGETGPDARPCHPQWVRDLIAQAQAAGVPCLFAGWGEWHLIRPIEDDHIRIKSIGDGSGNAVGVSGDGRRAAIIHDGKRRIFRRSLPKPKATTCPMCGGPCRDSKDDPRSGRLLDGVTYDGGAT